jgi:anaerobic selenocysteine-containing dehydrogenase
MLPNGRWQIASAAMLERLAGRSETPPADLVLTPRRQMAWSNSIRYGRAGAEASRVVRLHPDDARSRGLDDGAAVRVASRHGSLLATIAIDELVRPGVASMTHGHDGRSPGLLTSSTADVDPLTTMPLASGLAITIVAEPG